MKKTPIPSSTRSFPMTDEWGRHLPFDRAALGVGEYWYSLPDGDATAIGEINLRDSYSRQGEGLTVSILLSRRFDGGRSVGGRYWER